MIFLTMAKLYNVSIFLSSSVGGFPARKVFQDSLAKVPTVFPLRELTSETTREQRQAFLRSVPPVTLTVYKEMDLASTEEGREPFYVCAQARTGLPVHFICFLFATGHPASSCLTNGLTLLTPVAIWVWNAYNLTVF